MKKIIIKLTIILLFFQVLFPSVIMASWKGNLDTIDEVGTSKWANKFQIEFALEEWQFKGIKKDKFESWTDCVVGVIKYGLNKNYTDYVSEDGNVAYSKIINNNGSVSMSDISKYAKNSSNGMIGVITNTSNWVEESQSAIDKISDKIVEAYLKSIELVFKSNPATKWIINLWDSMKADTKKRIEYYGQKMIDNFGSIRESKFYAKSAQGTFNSMREISDNSNYDLGGTYEEKIKFSKEQITSYYDKYGYNYSFAVESEKFNNKRNQLEANWYLTMTDQEVTPENITKVLSSGEAHQKMREYAKSVIEGNAKAMTGYDGEGKIDDDANKNYQMPENKTADRTSNPSGVVEDAEAFVTTDSDNPYEQSYLKTESLQEFSQTLYSVLLGIGIVLAVIIGLILGIKFMLSSVAEKAQVKKLLVTYAIGCAVVFGAFGIWKLVVEIMKNI